MANFSFEIMPHLRNLTNGHADAAKQYMRFYTSDDSDSSCEFLDCETSDKCEINDVTSEGFLIKDA